MTDQASYFRTTETGDFPCPGGILKHMTVKSPALGARVDASVYVPEQAKGLENVPVVILLHGVYGSHWIWAGMGKAHTSLQSLIDAGEIEPMILVMPSDGLWGDGSAYLKHNSKDFEKWVVDEVPRLVSEVTGNSPDAPLFIAGLSMGGYGALRIGATYPDRFTAFAGHSSITRFSEMSQFVEEPLDAYGEIDEEENTVINTILRNKDSLPPFHFDCGVDDELIEGNRRLYAELREAGISCSYQEFPGGHEWPYWVEHIRDTFLFFGRCR
ncbi:MAG: alpha/beta hydrolase-fold protein [Akkermansiaceae bacterium]|nr:alpha/beta hydrolase-fold protein [Akkermansiaceae bacterium]MDP4721357.1 alpha/beta hydrolase-fold protein [Akkermansiaceae bacterium]MDP4779422.1 alpha/beta hydrolase-fold protein [Akkermansiaceae bacterium]MDP4846762.1 alpha/beta hydrolase-fold protein [Akkermansiaceae bacterium]MDP4897099.1 alpha/beta hydrolase-fold protein [Akkermansiaceae bacterium]